MQKSKADHQDEMDDDDDDNDEFQSGKNNAMNRRPAFSKKLVKSGKNEGSSDNKSKFKGKRFKTEIKRPEQILKQRKDKEKKMQKNLPKNIKKKRSRDSGGSSGPRKGQSFRKRK